MTSSSDPKKTADGADVDDPFRIAPLGKGSPYRTNPITGGIEFISPPGTPPVTSEDVRRALEDFP
jgi:hypothetical protein